MRLHVALAAGLLPSVLAVFADEAYSVDYHYALLGLPKQETTFFHKPEWGSKASLLYTLSDKSVLGAVNPKDGTNVWRQSLPRSEQATILRAGENQDTVISVAANTISWWNAADGRLDWDVAYGKTPVLDVDVLEFPAPSDSVVAQDIVVLSGDVAGVVQKLDAINGAVVWTYEDTSGDSPYRIAASATTVYLITYHQTTLSNSVRIRVTSIDPKTGEKVEEHTLGSSNGPSSLEDVVFVGSNSAARILAWTDKSKHTLHVNVLGTAKTSTFNVKTSGSNIESVTVHAAHLHHASPHFLVHYQAADAHWAEVFHVNLKDSSISKAYELPKLSGQGAFSAAFVDANVFFTRTTSEEVILFSSASHGILERWNVPNLRAASSEALAPVHATSEVVVKSATSYAVRSAVLLSNGDWVLVRNGDVSWSRAESLAGIVKAVWTAGVSSPELAETLETEAHTDPVSAYIHRVRRHLQDWQAVFSWVATLPKLILSSFSNSASLTGEDTFGFNRLVIAATESGRLIALESGYLGRIAWNIQGKVLSRGEKWTAASASPLLAELQTLQPADLQAWQEEMRHSQHSASHHQSTSFETTVTYTVKHGSLFGDKDGSHLWQFTPKMGERVLGTTQMLAKEVVASIGKVLGDRKVLYKYLNPNAVLVTGVDDARKRVSIYVLDAVSGTVLSSSTHKDVDITRPITSAISENWFAYSFASDPVDDTNSKGYQLVISEMLESTIPNNRGALGISANSSTIQPDALASRPVVISQTYNIPEEISSMAVTQTAQGITSRQLLVSLSGSNAIVAIPRQALEPRRIVGKDPSRSQMEEGLSRYAPELDFDPKWYLNHKEEIFGVAKIITAPALLESTSLIFAYGHDVFGTRVTPSFAFDVLGNSFNKIQLVITVVALTVGVFVVAPIIQRKQTNMLWQNS